MRGNEQCQNSDNDADSDNEENLQNDSFDEFEVKKEVQLRPTRDRKPPSYLKDYVRN